MPSPPLSVDIHPSRLAHLKEDTYNTLESGSPDAGHLRIATHNINGLEINKLRIILTYLTVKNIDVTVL